MHSRHTIEVILTTVLQSTVDPLSFIFILKTSAQRSSLWFVKKDLHYVKTIVLNVEVENRK